MPALAVLLALLNLTGLGLLFTYSRKRAKRLEDQVSRNQRTLQRILEEAENRADDASKRLREARDRLSHEVALTGHNLGARIPNPWQLRAACSPNRLLIVLSLPKCGGTTLHGTLTESFPNATVRHVHVHSRAGLDRMAKWVDESPSEAQREALVNHLRIADDIHAIRPTIPPVNICYFAGTREPISYALSEYFERHFTYPVTGQDISLEQIRNSIENGDVFPNPVAELDRWFDEELLPATGCNVFESEFPRNAGFAVYPGGDVRLCVYRLESFDVIRKALAETMNVPGQMISVATSNSAEGKDYAAEYRKVKNEIKFSRPFLERVYSSRYSRHFYSESERSTFLARWVDS